MTLANSINLPHKCSTVDRRADCSPSATHPAHSSSRPVAPPAPVSFLWKADPTVFSYRPREHILIFFQLLYNLVKINNTNSKAIYKISQIQIDNSQPDIQISVYFLLNKSGYD